MAPHPQGGVALKLPEAALRPEPASQGDGESGPVPRPRSRGRAGRRSGGRRLPQTPCAGAWPGPARCRSASEGRSEGESPAPTASRSSTASARSSCSPPPVQGCSWTISNPHHAAARGEQEEHVWFNSPMNSSHPVTPYSEVYGVHPKFFHFDRSGNKVSPWESFEPEISKLSSSDYSLASGHVRRLAPTWGSAPSVGFAGSLCTSDYTAPSPWSSMAANCMPNVIRTHSMPCLGNLTATVGDLGFGYCGYECSPPHQPTALVAGRPMPR